MKQQLLTAVAVLGASAGLATTTAQAASTKTAQGKLVGFTYSAAKKTGTVTVTSSKGKYVYVLNKTTDCGYSQGQMGDQIACKTLGASKFSRKPVTVNYHRDASGKRVAELVAIHL